MKKSIAFLTVIMLSYSVANAQTDKYTNAMKDALQQYSTANTKELMNDVELKFERIANAEKNQWLPFYYASQIKSLLSFQAVKEEDKELLADKAIELSLKADSLMPKNSEVACIKSLAQTVKMVISPMTRFMTYGSKAKSLIEEAKLQDATNPRPYVLEAMNIKKHTKNVWRRL